MKVAQVTYGANNSSVCVKLNEELNRLGVESDIVTIKSELTSNVVRVKENICFRIIRHMRYVLENKCIGIKYKKDNNAIFDICNYGLPHYQVKSLLSKYDVIHMHYVTGMLSYKDIERIASWGKTVVWTMHDCWAYTGGCHCGCDNYQKGCGGCEVLNSSDSSDVSANSLKQKKRTFGQSGIVVVSPSNWMDNRVSKSLVFKDNQHLCIFNGVDLETFKPYPRSKSSKYILLAGAVSPRTSPFKGYGKLVEAMKILSDRYPEVMSEIKLIFFGGADLSQIRDDFDDNIELEALGYVSNREELARIYSMSDLFLSTSISDNLPTTIIEAAACGTPTVAFDIGGISDIIVDGVTGKLIDNLDVGKYADYIVESLTHLGELRANCRKRAEECFDSKEMARNYLSLYQENSKK